MTNSNKDISTVKIIRKEGKIEFRISTSEKEILSNEAQKRNMTLSEFILTTLRKEILLGKVKEDFSSGATGDFSEVIKRIDLLEKSLHANLQENLETIKEMSAEYREDLLMYNTRDTIYWMLQQQQFQMKTHREIKDLLLLKDPALKEFLEETPRRMFTALDLALEKLQGEGKVILSDRGKIKWKK